MINFLDLYNKAEEVLDKQVRGKQVSNIWRILPTLKPLCAYYICLNIEDTEKVRSQLNECGAVEYCRHINDDKLAWENIRKSENAYLYCKYVKDRPEVRKLITSSEDAYNYCKYIKDSPAMMKHITGDDLAWYQVMQIRKKNGAILNHFRD